MGPIIYPNAFDDFARTAKNQKKEKAATMTYRSGLFYVIAAGAAQIYIAEDDRGPANNQMIKPRIGNMITSKDHNTLRPVDAADPKMEIRAQISSAKMIIPPIPVSSNMCLSFE